MNEEYIYTELYKIICKFIREVATVYEHIVDKVAAALNDLFSREKHIIKVMRMHNKKRSKSRWRK